MRLLTLFLVNFSSIKSCLYYWKRHWRVSSTVYTSPSWLSSTSSILYWLFYRSWAIFSIKKSQNPKKVGTLCSWINNLESFRTVRFLITSQSIQNIWFGVCYLKQRAYLASISFEVQQNDTKNITIDHLSHHLTSHSSRKKNCKWTIIYRTIF